MTSTSRLAADLSPRRPVDAVFCSDPRRPLSGVLIASFDDSWGATFALLAMAIVLQLVVVAWLGWRVSGTGVGAVVAVVTAYLTPIAVRAVAQGNTALLLSFPVGVLAGVGSATAVRLARRWAGSA